ncbi:MAG: glutamine synthetase type III [Flavobacteriales bacterium]|jgi:glutamine synthetase|nr:glutamine synthetase type III [Flavobacteriales bacterium]
MASFRFKALEEVLDRRPVDSTPPSNIVSDYYGANVFNKDAMREHLSKEAYKQVKEASNKGSRIDRKYANEVAMAMKAWAIGKGATHYTHWFQPLTGSTAEKHDAFFDPIEGGRSMEKFAGEQLVQQEPDASSFPNGGIRDTFEARGYTAWDPTSPAFVIGNALCIPTIFVAYTGEALDYKTPLLKALHAVDQAATPICKYFDKEVNKVTATLGWEQEYFLVDTALFNARPDLVLTGRTLFGHSSSKGQQLDDHYFGSIPDRVSAYIKEFETEAWQLGIPVKTRHNEVAPNQYECAPVFEEANLAVDHNQLLMDVMEKVARKHHFRVLLHEKPFAGMNGSGKHNNWSLSTNTGVNLLSPGHNPKTNLQFLTFLVNTIKALHDNADIVRAAIASAGNDHRLGANEAPPAIISCFIGSQLTQMLNDIEKNVKDGHMTPDEKTALKLGIGKIPDILLDNTDRNRTSPFAFTGNKFELRATGSSANCSATMIVLNTIIASQLLKFRKNVDAVIKKGVKKDIAILQVLRKTIVASKNIRFEGNGYGNEWVKEAQNRGLSNIKTTPQSLAAFETKEVTKLYEDMGVMTKIELDARTEIAYENYKLKIQIESRMMEDMSLNTIIPTAIKYQNTLLENVRGLKDVLGSGFKKSAKSQIMMVEEISDRISIISENVGKMVAERKKANAMNDAKKEAIAYCDKVVPFFDIIRYNVDKLELIIDDEMWPLPKYREMLFTR